MTPFPSNELVKTGVHCINGSVTVELSSNTKDAFAWPLVAMIVSVVPLTANLVILGAGTSVEVMSRT